MTITGDDQFYLPSRTFTFGDGTSYPVVWFDLGNPKIRRQPYDRVGNHGTILPRTDLQQARVVTCEIEVEGSSRADLQTKIDTLNTALAPSTSGDELLQFRLLGTTRQVYCRPELPIWRWTNSADTGLFLQSVDLEFYCQDPRIYSAANAVVLA